MTPAIFAKLSDTKYENNLILPIHDAVTAQVVIIELRLDLAVLLVLHLSKRWRSR